MKTNFSRKKKKITQLLAILFVLSAIVGLQLFTPIKNPLIDSNPVDPLIPTVDLAPSAISNVTGSGSNYNIVAHQSYYNKYFNRSFSNLDDSNTFDVPCPTDTNFNSSSSYFSVSNINAPNQTRIIEQNDTTTHYMTFDYTTRRITAVSFTVDSECYLVNFSIKLFINDPNDCDLVARVTSSDWSIANNRNEPDFLDTIGTCTTSGDIMFRQCDGWVSNFSLFFSPIYLDPSTMTANNTFYIEIRDSGTTNQYLEWYGIKDIDDAEGDNENAYYRSGASWAPVVTTGDPVDLTLIVDLAPLDNTPAPEDINMEINGTAIIGSGGNAGSATLPDVYGESDGDLTFQVTAGWWNVSCVVSQVQINYTKTSLIANSSFFISGSGLTVEWNVSINGGISGFDVNTPSSQYVNFTIPTHWDNEEIWNGTHLMTDTSWDVGGGTTIFTAWDAGDSLNWSLLATSSNLLQQINTSYGGSNLDEFNYGNDVQFTGNFSTSINNGDVNLTVYRPDGTSNFSFIVDASSFPGSQISLYSWDSAQGVDLPYGVYLSQAYWSNGTDAAFEEKSFTISALTELVLTSHGGVASDQRFKVNDPFNITLEYNDISKGIGVNTTNATYSHAFGSGYLNQNGTGKYYLELNPLDFDYGPNEITIEFNKTFHEPRSLTFWLNIVNTTRIENLSNTIFLDVYNFENVSCSFYYNDTANNLPIDGATLTFVKDDEGFLNYTKDHANGSYTITINVNNVTVRVAPYWVNVTVSKDGYAVQRINVSMRLIDIPTARVNYDPEAFTVVNYEMVNYTFFYNDTRNDEAIANATILIAKDHENFIISIADHDNGNYSIEIQINEVPASATPWQVDITILKNAYESQLITLDFTVNLIDINCSFVTNQTRSTYKRYEGTPYSATFFVNYTGTEIVADHLTTSDVQVSYDGGTGWPQGNFTLALKGGYFELNLSIDNVVSRNYYLLVNFSKAGIYTSTTAYLNFTLLGNNTAIYDADFTLRVGSTVKYLFNGRYNATEDDATLLFSLRIYDVDRGAYLTDYLSEDPEIHMSVVYNNGQGSLTSQIYWGNPIEGNIEIDALPDVGNYTITITITATNFESISKTFSIEILPGASGGGTNGIPLELIIAILIIVGSIVGLVVAVVGVQKGILAPKKRARIRTLAEVQSVFDDAVNIEHVLVLYKASGMCVYFKSLGLESIDPELISGFLSAVSSFGREMESQQALNEINYGDKKILLSDGEFIRVALVLSKEPSVITRQHLTEFIATFERSFSKVLPEWRGNLKSFNGAGKLVDDILNTSIILPHELDLDTKGIKSISRPISRDVMKIARGLVKESDRKYFFIAQLLTLSQKQLNAEKAKVFMGIKELRDLNVLKPIDITALESQPISQQEMNLISQKVSQMPNVAPEMKQKLVEDIAAIKNPVEREAFLTSLADHKEIVSMPVGGISPVKLTDAKSAKKEVSNLRKKARSYKSKKDYKNSLLVLNNAATIATSWELQKEFELVKDEMRVAQMEDQEAKMKSYELQAKNAEKAAKYKEAAQFYEMASKAASDAFKLGRDTLTTTIKRLSNKQRECEKQAQ
ncbi:MAG: hypothetical protein JW891_07400 [Candidatus Lokiarchaeota archaeon]|nr:hypothetical protein [Candidatus Lokiarchaeota archaeon]